MTVPPVKAIHVSCKRCGATVGKKCVGTKRGSHSERLEAAKRKEARDRGRALRAVLREERKERTDPLDQIRERVAYIEKTVRELKAAKRADDERIAQLEAENAKLRRALECALAVWCPHGHPGGDGADGETYELCCKALGKT